MQQISKMLSSSELGASCGASLVFMLYILSLCSGSRIVWCISQEIFQKKYITQIVHGIMIIGLFQAIWMLPFFVSQTQNDSGLSAQIQNYDIANFEAFQDTNNVINVYTEHAALRGYWGEYQHRFIPSDLSSTHGKVNTSLYIIWFLILFGLAYRCKTGITRRDLVFALLGGGAFVFSLGVSNDNIFSGLNMFLYDYFPLYTGFREPQKWLMFLVMSYCYFGMFGLISISKLLEKIHIQKYALSIIMILLSLTPLYYSYNMLFGFSGQVSIQSYPPQWQEIKNILGKQEQPGEYTTLVLPWHGYIGIKWTHKKVGAWISEYFGDTMLYGDSSEIGDVYSTSTRSESKLIESYIGPDGRFRQDAVSQKEYQNFTQDIQDLGIQNILLLKEADFTWYKEFLDVMMSQGLLEVSRENSMIRLYKIKTQ